MEATLQAGVGALSGIRVLDLSQGTPGAQSSQLLADFGADVIWVEPPDGSCLRKLASYPCLARGKRSLVADLRSDQGIETVRDLARTADVLIETFRPGVAERLGLGYDLLSDSNPGLVYASITGFGRHGPWSRIQGYEGAVASIAGAQAAFSDMHEGKHPPFLAAPWCSFSASQTALHGILAALFERERSGLGQQVEASMLQAFATLDASGTWFLQLITQRWPGAYQFGSAMNERGVPNTPFTYRTLVAQTKDGRWLQFAQASQRLLEAFVHALGLGWMFTDPKWKGFPVLEEEALRLEAWERMLTAVGEKTFAEWEALFDSNRDVFAELFRDGPEVLNHPQLIHDGLVLEIEDPERGIVRQPGPLVIMDRTPAAVGAPAPVLNTVLPMEWQSAARSSRPGRPMSDANGRFPLEGVTILEFAVWYAAPYGATLLTDLGARVIKLESLAGDDMRYILSFFPEAGSAKVMQGKESVAVDLRTPEGVDIAHKLAVTADIVLDGFREGVTKRCQVDADTLLRINPNLVYLRARGYGIDGPCSDRPSFAPSIAAAAGIAMAQLGGSGQKNATSMADIRKQANRLRAATASLYAQSDGCGALGVATALLLGLLARERGAGGQQMMTSMLLTNAHLMVDNVVDYANRPASIAPGPDMRGPCALYRIYEAADGWIFLAAHQSKEWARLARAFAPFVDLQDDPRFATAEDRQANDAALTEALTNVFARRGKEDWQRDLTRNDVACVWMTTTAMETALISEEGRAGGYIADVTHPVFDEHPRLAPVVRFSRSPTQVKPGVLCGSATRDVLKELGYDDMQVSDMLERKIIATSE